MQTQAQPIAPSESSRETAATFGFWVCLLTPVLTIITFTIAILTPPRSGPFCRGFCVLYPYSDTAPFFPRDFWWIFPALSIPLLFLFLCACTHSWVRPSKTLFTRIAMLLAAIAASSITLDYFLQIEVLQPSLLRSEIDGMALISQYNPHGLFIAMENLGYLMMSISMFFLGLALSHNSRLENFLRWQLIVSGKVGFATFVAMSLYFGTGLETRFELAIITIDWFSLVVASIVLSILFRRTSRISQAASS
ncbi:MAG TPA: hypothetical protein VN753_18175 [Terracidiphilus sp.]|jgi:hypothetical protein|nr:hypothetical protein [Terracidiphilus sp.]